MDPSSPATSSLLLWTSLLAASTSLTFAVWRMVHSRRRSCDTPFDAASTYCTSPLFELEAKLARLGIPPVATFTLVHAENFDHVVEILRKRWQAIGQANPWLLSRLVDKGSHVEAIYPKQVNDEQFSKEPYFCVVKDCVVQALQEPLGGFSYTPLARQLSKFALRGKEDLSGKPRVKLSLIPTDISSCFYLVFSMSHCIGDGHTYYKLLSMLVGDLDVSTMVFERNMSCDFLQEKAMGVIEKSIWFSWGHSLSCLRGAIARKLYQAFCPQSTHVQSIICRVDPHQIERIKAESQSTTTGASFVSTNDIVTSWVSTKSGCEHGLMAVNFRGKLQLHDDDMAGNYENIIYYRIPEDVASPGLIRSSVQNLRRTVSHRRPYSNWSMASQNHALTTNWTTFYPKTSFDGLQLKFHYPLFDTSKTIPHTLLLCVLFQEEPDQLSFLISSAPRRIRSFLAGADFTR